MASSNDTNEANSSVEVTLFLYSTIQKRFIGYYKLEIVLYTITIITNSLTLIVISCNSKLRILSNVFFACLATTDFVQGILGLAFNGMRLYGFFIGGWDFIDDTSLAALQFVWWLAIMCSYASLLDITLERWLFISHPYFHERHWNGKNVVKIIIFWLGINTMASSLFINGDMKSTNVGFLFPIFHTLEGVAIMIAYAHIAVISYRQQEAITKTQVQIVFQNSDAQRPRILSKNWKAVRLSVTVFAMYFCTVSPWVFFQAFKGFSHDSLDTEQIAQALNTLSILHFCSNFFVYAIQNREFYAVLRKYFRRLCCLNHSTVNSI